MRARRSLFVAALVSGSVVAQDGWDTRVLAAGAAADARIAEPRTLNDAYHPWQPPASLAEWRAAARSMRERARVATGLWPMPPRAPLAPVVHGLIEREDYTVAKVYFASWPGHYVTGSLYRPRGFVGPRPGVLCPHGHWRNGRAYDAGDKQARADVASGAESRYSAARYPLQARMVQLARMGCVVFHYDMVGYASSKPIPHRSGFNDARALLWLQSTMGLQTWNSIRALDFVLSLPDVDATRIAVTGASGGGTQTFMLCAVDPRPDVAFPAVMVSTAMQGGCVCENAPYLRIGINNVALAALFAPRPLALSGADDWTKEIETKGLPELEAVWGLFRAGDRVAARAFPQFRHNYNERARKVMYAWLDRHLRLHLAEPDVEREFEPLTSAELAVFDDAHPLPDDAASAEQLRGSWTRASRSQLEALSSAGPEAYRRVVGAAARVLLDGPAPSIADVEITGRAEHGVDSMYMVKATLSRRGAGERVPFVAVVPSPEPSGAVLWIDGAGKRALVTGSGPRPHVRRLLDANLAVCSIDVLGTGELAAGAKREVHGTYAGYTFCYNRPLFADRVRDVLTAIAAVPAIVKTGRLDLVGTGDAGAWVLAARGLVAGDRVRRTVADLGGRGFGGITRADDPMLLPGALKYGGVGGLAALALPAHLAVHGTAGVDGDELEPLRRMVAAAGGRVSLAAESLAPDAVARALLD